MIDKGSVDSGDVSVGRIVKSRAYFGGYNDLDVYKNSYNGMLKIFKNILGLIPKEEKYDLIDQLSRSSKAIPRLIAEGHAKRHQNKGFQKYIDDSHAEANETIVSLNQVKDLYINRKVDADIADELIDLYDKISRQLYNLSRSWSKYHDMKRRT